jgi:hypothetical protein
LAGEGEIAEGTTEQESFRNSGFSKDCGEQSDTDQLVLKEENVKITISLKKSSVEFFKKEA